MADIFSVREFEFPYRYKFPGQASNEQILFVIRENPVMLTARRTAVVIAAVAVLVVGYLLEQLLLNLTGPVVANLVMVVSLGLALGFGVIGWWWVSVLWQRSLALVTTMRLIKFIYTTPANRHSLALPLDMIVDTGAYSKGFLQAFFKLGTFTARSSAASSGAATDDPERVNKKYFYIENIAIAEDLQHYVSKVLYAFRHHHDQLATFRPFIPHLKGDARKEFMRQYPEYWS